MKIGPAEIGILASIGKTDEIRVYRKPSIGILSTGNELVNSREKDLQAGNGKIRDSNTHMISSILHSYGFSETKSYGIIKDTIEDIEEKFT